MTTTFPFWKHNTTGLKIGWGKIKLTNEIQGFTATLNLLSLMKKHTLWWEGEIMRTRMPERYNVIAMGIFNQNTLLFNFHSHRLALPVISFDWHRSKKTEGADYFPLRQAMMVRLYQHEYYYTDHFSDLWKSFHVWTRCDWHGITCTVDEQVSLCRMIWHIAFNLLGQSFSLIYRHICTL